MPRFSFVISDTRIILLSGGAPPRKTSCFCFSTVPQNALPSDLLENVLCGVAFGLGVLGIIVGLVLIIYFRKPCSGGMLGHLEGLGGLWEPYSGACVGVPE